MQKIARDSTVNAYQEVNPKELAKYDRQTKAPSGNFMWHEIAEGYEGGRISLGIGIALPNSIKEGTVYPEAHSKAGVYFPGTIHQEFMGSIAIPDIRRPMIRDSIKMNMYNFKLGR